MTRDIARPALRWLPLALLCALGGCDEDPATEVLVVVHSDLEAGSELTALTFEVRDEDGGGAEEAPLRIELDAREDLPLTISIASRSARADAFRLIVTGMRDDERIIEQQLRARFAPRRTVELRVFLGRACLGVLCDAERAAGRDVTCLVPPGQTCVDVPPPTDLPEVDPRRALDDLTPPDITVGDDRDAGDVGGDGDSAVMDGGMDGGGAGDGDAGDGDAGDATLGDGDGDGDIDGGGDGDGDADPCATGNGGCDPVSVCGTQGDAVVCGSCAAGYVGNGDDGCAPLLDSLVETAVGLSLDFDPTQYSYAFAVGVTTGEIALTPTVAAAGASVRVQGQLVTSGQSSGPITVNGGLNTIDVVVEQAGQPSTTYTVEVTRGSMPTFLKADSTSQNAFFGTSVAIDGDTIVVGAPNALTGGKAFVFVRNGQSWSPQGTLVPSNAAGSDDFGGSVAIDGDTIVVGNEGDNDNTTGPSENVVDAGMGSGASNSGAAWVFVRDGSSWSPQAYLKGSNTGAGDLFGATVAISGDTIAVGAAEEASDGTGVGAAEDNDDRPGSGAVYVFTRSDTTWTQQRYIKASEPNVDDEFGSRVDIDGDTLVVGSRNDRGSGTVEVFTRTADVWSFQQLLQAEYADSGDLFGMKLSLDADQLAIAAPRERNGMGGINSDASINGPGFEYGAVYLFERSEGTWTQATYFKPIITDNGDNFGVSVALEGDLLLVGAYNESGAGTELFDDGPDNDDAVQSGAAYLFRRADSGWRQDAFIKAPVRDGDDADDDFDDGDFFGVASGVSGDTLVICSHHEDSISINVGGDVNDNSRPNSGACFVYR